MNELIEKEAIVALAFQRPIVTTKIPDGMINSVQIRHIKPCLGLDFYNAIVAAPETYDAVIDLIKPAIAFFTKFYILPELYNDISNSGINKIPGINRAAGTVEDLGSARQIALDQANLAMDALTYYLKENYTSYPLYVWQQDPNSRVEIAGGILSRKSITLDEEDTL